MNGWWCWLGKCYPAGPNNDITLHDKEYNSIVKKVDKKREAILVDLAWWSTEVREDPLFIVGHKKPRNGVLIPEQENENNILGHFRGISFKHVKLDFQN